MEQSSKSRRDFLRKVSLATPVVGSVIAGTNGAAAAVDSEDTRQLPETRSSRTRELTYDVVVYGGTSAGVIAAYAAKMYGLKVLLVEPGRHLGGMSSGGLGATDTGGKDNAITGLSREFYIRVSEYYGGGDPVYRFEPHVAEKIFNSYVDEADVEVFYSRRVAKVDVRNSKIRRIELERSNGTADVISVSAAFFIDTSYEGDLMSRAKVSYTVGRESNDLYNEKYNGVVLSRTFGPYGNVKRISEWPVPVDPYVVPGKPSSGLLPEINSEGHPPIGSGDRSVQSYCFRLCLTQNTKNMIPLSEPDSFNPDRYELLVRLLKKRPWEQLGKGNGFIISPMPNGKTDWNNYGYAGFSSNYTGKSHDYPDADYGNRRRIWNDHIDYQKGLLWFLATDERVPAHLRKEMNSWGYCRDEFLDGNGWPHQLYIREARRMISDFVMTEHEVIGTRPVNDGIAYGAYAMDSHTCNRVVVEGRVENEGNTSIEGFEPYLISYRSIVPKREEITNLLVPVCLSASHGAYSSIRMEPVFMALGQAAAVAAWLAAKAGRDVQDVDPKEIVHQLRGNPLVNRKVSREYAEVLPFRIL